MAIIEPGKAVSSPATALAGHEKSKLIRSLRRSDMFFFTLCAFFGPEALGTIAAHGPQGLLWMAVLAIIYVLPYALMMAEVGSAFTQEGGPYEWVKLAFNKFHGGLVAFLYWATNPLWLGGSLAFVATAAWSGNVSYITSGSIADYVFKLLFIWLSIGAAIIALRHGKLVSNVGGVLRIVLITAFLATIVIYAADHGLHGFPSKKLRPTGSGFLGIVPLVLFVYVGFELQNGAAEEMKNPQRDVPASIIRSAIVGLTLYIVPLLGILIVLPAGAVSSISGFLDAVKGVFEVYGGAAPFLRGVMAIVFIGCVFTNGVPWMIGSDRVLAIAAAEGCFHPFFGRFSRRLGTPVRVNAMTGILATTFMVVAVAAFNGGSDSKFLVLLNIAIATTLISYLWIFPAVLKLRLSHPDVPRPYRYPGGTFALVISTALISAWVALGTWIAVAPGILEGLFGLRYDFHRTWGVRQGAYEVVTLSTLGAILLVGMLGYISGRRSHNTLAIKPDAGSQDLTS